MGMFDDLVPSAGTAAPNATAPESKIRFDAIDAPNWFEQQLAKITLPESADWGLNRARGFVMGAADPMVGAVQLGANIVGQGDGINRAITDRERQYEQERKAVGSEGFDFARMTGNMASPANLSIAKIPMAATTGKRILQGAVIGAAGGLSQPVTEPGSFAGQKAMQGITGSVVGGGLTPVVGKVADLITKKLAFSSQSVQQAAADQADVMIEDALREVGQRVNDLPPQALQELKDQVVQALKAGKQLSPAAILRMNDFKAAGIPALQGQISRDPMQFARELNLRGVAGVGEPIAARLERQNQILQDRLSALRSGADETFNAGDQISNAMKAADDKMGRVVSGMYQQARNSAGKDMDVPLTGLAQDYARVLSDFGDNVPGAIRGKFAALGLDPANPSNQRSVFTIEDADKLLKVINKNDPGYANRPMSAALAELRSAVKNAVIGADSSGGPFAPAVKAAAERFQIQDAIPSLKAAAEGRVAPDDFVNRFIINGKAREVAGMSKVLEITDPAAHQQARAQMGQWLYQQAFGADVGGIKNFSAERFNRALQKMGTAKLNAFFSTEEIAQIRRLGRVGAYIHQAPSGSAVNYSNTASAAMNIAGRIPGMSPVVSLANAAKTAVNNRSTVKTAINPSTPVTSATVPAEYANVLAALLSGGTFAGGGFAGAAFRKLDAKKY